MEIWMREKFHSFANIIIRVPPLFLIDGLLRIGLGVPDDPLEFNSTDVGFDYSIVQMPKGSWSYTVKSFAELFATTSQNWSGLYENIPTYEAFSYQLFLFTILKLVTCFLGCLAALCTFLLEKKHLMVVYCYLTSIAIVFISYWANLATVSLIITYQTNATLSLKNGGDDTSKLNLSQLFYNWNYSFDGPGVYIIQNYVLQSILSYIFFSIHREMYRGVPSFTFPSYVGVFSSSVQSLKAAPPLGALYPLGICIYVFWSNIYSIWRVIQNGYILGRNFIANYGLSALLETHWARLQVPSVLRTFWILRVAEQLVQILLTEYGQDFSYYAMIKTLMVNGCETLTAVLGMTSIISVICHYIGSFFQWVLLNEEEDEKSIGTISAILFYILALQTGLTSLDKEHRLLRLCRNLCLLFTAVLHFVHNIVNPLLMSLSASHNPALHRHIRALAVCAFLIVFPVWLLSFLWSQYTMSTWLLAVSIFSIEVVVKVLVSLAIYSLFLYDAFRKTFWDELDDWVYFIRSFGNTVEFAFGIILFFNGFWILVFEAGGTIRALMMCVHAYFNLWCEAKAGWNVFIKRRQAVNKINSLPDATAQQLQELNDVCAICYQDMENAKITFCNHFFHSVCLRKWLYVQDRCPLCHDILHKPNNGQKEQQTQTVEQDAVEREEPEENPNVISENSLSQIRMQQDELRRAATPSSSSDEHSR